MSPDLEFKVNSLRFAINALTPADRKAIQADPVNSSLAGTLASFQIASQTVEQDAVDRLNTERISVGLPEV